MERSLNILPYPFISYAVLFKLPVQLRDYFPAALARFDRLALYIVDWQWVKELATFATQTWVRTTQSINKTSVRGKVWLYTFSNPFVSHRRLQLRMRVVRILWGEKESFLEMFTIIISSVPITIWSVPTVLYLWASQNVFHAPSSWLPIQKLFFLKKLWLVLCVSDFSFHSLRSQFKNTLKGCA